jgi:hypothetical protein
MLSGCELIDTENISLPWTMFWGSVFWIFWIVWFFPRKYKYRCVRVYVWFKDDKYVIWMWTWLTLKNISLLDRIWSLWLPFRFRKHKGHDLAYDVKIMTSQDIVIPYVHFCRTMFVNVNMIDTEKYQPARQNMKLMTSLTRHRSSYFGSAGWYFRYQSIHIHIQITYTCTFCLTDMLSLLNFVEHTKLTR